MARRQHPCLADHLHFAADGGAEIGQRALHCGRRPRRKRALSTAAAQSTTARAVRRITTYGAVGP